MWGGGGGTRALIYPRGRHYMSANSKQNTKNLVNISLYVKSSKNLFNISEEDNALRHAVAETWISKDFADVEVLCGVDGGIVLTHRIILVRKT